MLTENQQPLLWWDKYLGATDYLKGNSCYGKGEYVIAEADESDGTFLKFSPFLSIITNIEDDHLDYYGTFENIKKAFIEFIERISDEMA